MSIAMLQNYIFMKNLLFLLLSFTTGCVWAQTEVFPPTNELQKLDDSQLEVVYNVKYVFYKDKEIYENDKLHVEIGKSVVHSYVEGERRIDHQQTRFFIKNGRRSTRMNIHAVLGETYLNYPQKGTLSNIMYLDVAGMHLYEEQITDFKWKITQEKKEVLGYICTAATCKFRGREYTAWFTSEIPFSYGPWKFCGLPGLILEISDSEGDFSFVATGLQKPQTQTDINWWNREYVKAKRERCLKLEAMLHKDQSAFASDYGISFALDGEEVHYSQPYHPIELK